MSTPLLEERVVKKTLPNGLTVLVTEDRAAPIVAVNMWFGVGSVHETEEVNGLAHFQEHMVFKGTEKYGVGEIANIVRSAGGNLNAGTSFSYTMYYIVLPSQQFNTALEVQADAMMHSTFDPDEFQKERIVVMDEARMYDDRPESFTFYRTMELGLREAHLPAPHRRLRSHRREDHARPAAGLLQQLLPALQRGAGDRRRRRRRRGDRARQRGVRRLGCGRRDGERTAGRTTAGAVSLPGPSRYDGPWLPGRRLPRAEHPARRLPGPGDDFRTPQFGAQFAAVPARPRRTAPGHVGERESAGRKVAWVLPGHGFHAPREMERRVAVDFQRGRALQARAGARRRAGKSAAPDRAQHVPRTRDDGGAGIQPRLLPAPRRLPSGRPPSRCREQRDPRTADGCRAALFSPGQLLAGFIPARRRHECGGRRRCRVGAAFGAGKRRWGVGHVGGRCGHRDRAAGHRARPPLGKDNGRRSSGAHDDARQRRAGAAQAPRHRAHGVDAHRVSGWEPLRADGEVGAGHARAPRVDQGQRELRRR